jgi:predicted component of type VI protein secretion system
VAVTALTDPYDVVLSLATAYTKGGLCRDARLCALDASQGALAEQGAAVLVRNGFLVGTSPLAVAAAVQRPRRYHQPARNAQAQTTARLSHVLTTSRFLHAATCLSRDAIGSCTTMAELESALNRWLGNYIDDRSGEAAAEGPTLRPLAEARFTACDVLGAPGEMEVVLDLRLNMGGLPTAFRTRHTMITIRPFL